VDSFFKGYTPWTIWLAGMCAIWSLLLPAERSRDWVITTVWLLGGVAASIVWSLRIDLQFFRAIVRNNEGSAVRRLALHRLISWSVILAVVGAPTIWSDVVGRLW
jgi:hypothetical protein